jgi:hypothetical protein
VSSILGENSLNSFSLHTTFNQVRSQRDISTATQICFSERVNLYFVSL